MVKDPATCGWGCASIVQGHPSKEPQERFRSNIEACSLTPHHPTATLLIEPLRAGSSRSRSLPLYPTPADIIVLFVPSFEAGFSAV
jgi:hypothetical protein